MNFLQNRATSFFGKKTGDMIMRSSPYASGQAMYSLWHQPAGRGAWAGAEAEAPSYRQDHPCRRTAVGTLRQPEALRAPDLPKAVSRPLKVKWRVVQTCVAEAENGRGSDRGSRRRRPRPPPSTPRRSQSPRGACRPGVPAWGSRAVPWAPNRSKGPFLKSCFGN